MTGANLVALGFDIPLTYLMVILGSRGNSAIYQDRNRMQQMQHGATHGCWKALYKHLRDKAPASQCVYTWPTPLSSLFLRLTVNREGQEEPPERLSRPTSRHWCS